MKRLIPAGLITFLQQNPNCLKADLFVITLPTGTTIYVTEGQRDIVVPTGTSGMPAGWTTQTFLSTTYGRWKRGAITSEASFALSANSMTLTCEPQQGTAYPGMTIGLLNAAFNGLFDASLVTVYTAYMPSGSYGNVSNGIETKFVGFIEKIQDINRTKVEVDVPDPMYLLNEKVPKRLIQAPCPWSFGDGNCNVPGGIGAFTQAFTAKTGSTQWVLIPVTAFTQAAGDFTQGVAKCVTGANSGLSQTVKLHAAGNLTMTVPWLLPVAAGDTFTVVTGCDKSVTRCTQRFNNKVHFGGATEVPVPIQGM